MKHHLAKTAIYAQLKYLEFITVREGERERVIGKLLCVTALECKFQMHKMSFETNKSELLFVKFAPHRKIIE